MGLEVGCGAGLASLAYAKARPRNGPVVLSDYDEYVLGIAMRNASVNELSEVAVRRVEFGADLERNGAQKVLEEFGRFSLVVGSDVVYDGNQVSHVVAAADYFL